MNFLDEPATQLLTFSIEADGARLPETLTVSALRAHLSLTALATAEIALLVQADDEFDGTPFMRLAIGTGVSLHLGYGHVEDMVFSGPVTAQTLNISDNGARLIVSCSGDRAGPTAGEAAHTLRLGTDVENFQGTLGATGLEAELRMQGTALFHPGATVGVPELPGGFGMSRTILAVEHEVDMGQWITTLRI